MAMATKAAMETQAGTTKALGIKARKVQASSISVAEVWVLIWEVWEWASIWAEWELESIWAEWESHSTDGAALAGTTNPWTAIPSWTTARDGTPTTMTSSSEPTSTMSSSNTTSTSQVSSTDKSSSMPTATSAWEWASLHPWTTNRSGTQLWPRMSTETDRWARWSCSCSSRGSRASMLPIMDGTCDCHYGYSLK